MALLFRCFFFVFVGLSEGPFYEFFFSFAGGGAYQKEVVVFLIVFFLANPRSPRDAVCECQLNVSRIAGDSALGRNNKKPACLGA